MLDRVPELVFMKNNVREKLTSILGLRSMYKIKMGGEKWWYFFPKPKRIKLSKKI